MFTIVSRGLLLVVTATGLGLALPALAGADLIIVNADIRTADPANPAARAMAVKDGRLIAVGGRDAIAKLADRDTQVIDAQGRSLLPGFIDGHTHLGGGVDLVNGVDLFGIAEREAWLERIARRSAQLTEDQWLLGGRWDYTLAGDRLPTRQDIDRVVADRPVALNDIDHHSMWLNSKALELLEITADTPVPPGGEIVIDAATGAPTGILKEGATFLVSGSVLLQRSPEARRAGLRATLGFANSLGITGVHDMSGAAGLEDYLGLLEAGDLPMRVWFGAYPDGSMADARRHATRRREIAERVAKAGLVRTGGPRLALGYFKTMIDGVLSTRTAAMIAPYADRPGITGTPFMSQQRLTDFVRAGNAVGFPVAIHAIGDRGVAMALTAFADVGAEGGVGAALPNRIEHIEVIDPSDIRRFARLGVVASMQPDHATSTIGKYITQRLGPAREANAYVWQKMLAAGVPLVFGSDWPTAPLNPLIQIADAVFRESPTDPGSGPNPGPWHPENAVSFEQALRAYTRTGADISGWGDQIGSLRVGKWADFVILDATLAQPLERSIRARRVVATYIAGKAVYERD